MKTIIEYLNQYKTLSREEAHSALLRIGNGEVNHSQMAAFLTIFSMRSVTPQEISGFRDALQELYLHVDFSDFETMDLCGTGGDGKNTFNISTLASFIVAGAGVKVSKHGNYGASSNSGSSNLLEYLGYQFTNNADALRREIDQANICFLHAPKFHPAMKHVAPVRKELGMKTFFNILGPMINPTNPQTQLIGVFNAEVARLYNYVYQKTPQHYAIVHSLDLYDEISLTAPFRLITREGEQIISPEEIGMPITSREAIDGGKNVEEAADIFLAVLQGKGTEIQQKVALVNAAYALQTARPELSTAEALNQAELSLESGAAYDTLKRLLEINRQNT